jgi:hypothetical protein
MFRKLGSYLGLSSVDPPTYVRVQHLKALYDIEFDAQDSRSSKGVTVGFLRSRLTDLLKPKPNQTVVLYQIKPQRKLVDDTSFLSDYDIQTADKLLAILSGEKGPRAPVKQQPPPPPPKSPTEKIQEVLDDVEKNLVPHIQMFIDGPPIDGEDRTEQHRRLSEMVLQKMFMLDDVDVSDDQDLRQFRKSAINKLHAYHTSLDTAFKQKSANGAMVL